MAEKLKPCPFCKGPVIVFQSATDKATKLVNCPKLDCPGHYAIAKIEDWNHRPIEQHLIEALENLIIAIGMGWDLDGVVEVSMSAVKAARGEA